jgi:TetR/AcrR family transcriptional regulator
MALLGYGGDGAALVTSSVGDGHFSHRRRGAGPKEDYPGTLRFARRMGSSMSVPVDTVQTVVRDVRREARKRERHTERRRLIMRAARQLLIEGGIEHFTVAQVAQVAHVSKPAVYYYFESKEDLVFELSVEVLEAERVILDRATTAAPSAVDALAVLIRERVSFYLSDPDSFRILHVWAPVLGLQSRVEAAPAYAAIRAILVELGRRLLAERPLSRASSHVLLDRIAELAWALALGIIGSTVLNPKNVQNLARAEVMRDDACRWLLDSLVG